MKKPKKKSYSKGYWSSDCSGCDGKNCPYAVTSEVWSAVVKPGDFFLRLFCVEQRLGRQLTKDDFIDYPINKGMFGFATFMWVDWRPNKEQFETIRKEVLKLGLS